MPSACPPLLADGLKSRRDRKGLALLPKPLPSEIRILGKKTQEAECRKNLRRTVELNLELLIKMDQNRGDEFVCEGVNMARLTLRVSPDPLQPRLCPRIIFSATAI